jgi:hypothetical protein
VIKVVPRRLNNPAARHINVNFSIDGRAKDLLDDEAGDKGIKTSQLVNLILKERYNIKD